MALIEDADPALDAVVAQLERLDPDRSRMAATLRATLDQLYDGQHTGRYRWDQLFKTEKTHCGTLVEINLQREFKFDDGLRMDYSIAGLEVDCKYSQSMGGWMIPNEARNELCLVLTASDTQSAWSAGIVRARPEWLNTGKNRDAKATLSATGRDQIRWLALDAMLPPNALLALPTTDVEAIFAAGSGQRRVTELFRRAQRVRIGRGVVATVAQQQDYMKRVRGNGGARTALRAEGVVIFGAYSAHQRLATQLGLERLESGESMSARLTSVATPGPWTAEIDGRHWRIATEADPPEAAPLLPNVSEGP